MASPLQLLILEPNAFDAKSAVSVLEGADYSCSWDHVQTQGDLLARLERRRYDLILADYRLPDLDRLSALHTVRERGIDIPFIVCSAPIGAEALTEVFRAGATDYLLKTRLNRLPLVVARALKEQDQRQRKHAEEAALLEMATDIQGVLDLGEILARVHRNVLMLLPCDRVLTYRWDAARGAVQLLAAHGNPETVRLDAAEADGIAGLLQAWIERRPVRGSRADAEPSVLRDRTKPFGGLALLGAPLTIAGALTGVMVAVREDSDVRFEPCSVQLIERIARQLMSAMGAADRYCAKDEEAQVNGALAEVGRVLLSESNRPDLLNRLCQVTTRVLSCGRTCTALWNPQEGAYVPVASYGYTAEAWEALRVTALPHRPLAHILARLEQDDVVPVLPSESKELSALIPMPATMSLCMALRRGRVLQGIHIATFDQAAADVPRYQRLGYELARLVSLAVDNVGILEERTWAARLRSDFVATMAHELRTPLNAILGYTDLALQTVFGPLTAEQGDALRCVQDSGHQLLDLVNAALDVSQLDAGTLPINLGPIRVPDLIAEVETDTRETRQQSRLRFFWKVPAHLPHIETDRVKLKVVVMNLIGNAIKFTPRGSVTVAVRTRDDGIEIAVADTGIGMDQAALSIMFEPFRQGDSSTTRRFGGVGLGLYIVRRMLDLLGGTIEVESQVGLGSTFRAWVPRTIATGQGQALKALASREARDGGVEATRVRPYTREAVAGIVRKTQRGA